MQSFDDFYQRCTSSVICTIVIGYNDSYQRVFYSSILTYGYRSDWPLGTINWNEGQSRLCSGSELGHYDLLRFFFFFSNLITWWPLCMHIAAFLMLLIVRRAGLLLSQQDFEWRWSVPLFQCLTVLEFSFILFDLCLLITFFNFIMNYVPIVTFWIFTYHKIWILSIMFCFIWSYWIIYFLACL